MVKKTIMLPVIKPPHSRAIPITDGQLLHVNYLGRVTCDCDPKEKHGHTHPSHHGKQQCMPRIPIA